MKKDVLSAWLRELCTIVFTQTLQAFLLAIMMSMVLKALALADLSKDSAALEASGLFCIVALLTFSKIELLVKNIFGVVSGQGDPSLANGKRGLTAGSLLAFRSAGRVLDNGKKFFGGGVRALTGGVRTWKAKHDLYDYQIGKKKFDDEPNEEMLNDGSVITKQYSSGKGGSVSSGGTGAISRLADSIENLNSNIVKQNMTAAKDKNDSKKNDKIKELQAAIDTAKKDRNEGLKSMVSGFAETVGAAHGAVAGAVIGGAIGDEIPEAALKGMGVGDMAGQSFVNIASKAPNVKNTVQMTYNEIQREGRNREAYKKLREEIAEDNKKSFDDLQQKLDMYAKQGLSSKTNSNNISKGISNIRTTAAKSSSSRVSRPKSLDNEQ